jgi:hypothetical protein
MASRKRRRKWKGDMTSSHTPVWQPLLDLVGTYLTGDFMWMFEVELEDGRSLHAYKHWWTRRYIHLTIDGRAFVYQGRDLDGDDPARYLEVEPNWLLDRVLPRGQQLGDYREFQEEVRARQDSNLRPLPPEGSALSS